MTQHLLLGQTLGFSGNPLTGAWQDTVQFNNSGGVLVASGKIVATGDGADLRQAYPQALVTNYGNALITAGFVDAHMHYPQTGIIASWGKQLIDWLNTYTFPEECRFGDRPMPMMLRSVAARSGLAHGTTTQTSFCTIHPASVDAFFRGGSGAEHGCGCGQDLHGSQRARLAARYRAIGL